VGVSSFSVRQVLRERSRQSGDGAGNDGGGLPVVPAPMPRTDERQAARFGQLELEEAEPVFTSRKAQLPLAGLLLALPSLQATGLLEVAEATYGKLRNGFYGLRSCCSPWCCSHCCVNHGPRAQPGWCQPILGRILAPDQAPGWI
jgi:hypothetical protein